MRLKNAYSLIGAFMLLFSPALLLAESEEPPWYEIELIIYANHNATAVDSELWPDDPGLPNRLNTVSLDFNSVTGSEAIQPVAYRQLPDDLLQLTDIYSKLAKRRGSIEPLLHLAWRQQVESRESAQSLYLVLPADQARVGAGLPDQIELPRLEGSIKVSVKRYLHIDFDMVTRRLITPSPTAMRNDFNALTPLSPYYQAYRTQTHRRMRSNELHYLDHPLIGALITARRFEPVEPTTEIEEPAVDEITPVTAPQNSPALPQDDIEEIVRE